MFSRSEYLYDTIYLNMGKDYAAEADLVHALIQEHRRSTGDFLLDVACGTGIHIGYLRRYYRLEGLDLDRKMLAIARKKFPGLSFHQGDMVDFDLHRQFDAITCLFSSIGYVRSLSRLGRTIANLSRHLLPGGVLLVEPWFSPGDWNTGKVHAAFVDKPDLKIARMSISKRKARLSSFTFHYLVAASGRIRYFNELHEMGLFTDLEYLQAFRAAGLQVLHDPAGLDGRGLYIGIRASS